MVEVLYGINLMCIYISKKRLNTFKLQNRERAYILQLLQKDQTFFSNMKFPELNAENVNINIFYCDLFRQFSKTEQRNFPNREN